MLFHSGTHFSQGSQVLPSESDLHPLLTDCLDCWCFLKAKSTWLEEVDAHYGIPTLCTPWSWQNIVSTTAPERAVLSILSLGVVIQTGQSGVSEVAETCIFLASIWFAVAGHVILFWLWLPQRGRWTAPVDSEIQRKMCEMLGISSVKRLPSGGTRCRMPQQTRYAGVCADWEQKLCVFQSRPKPHRHGQCHWQLGSSLVWRLWLARFVSDWKAPPSDVTARTD